MPRFGVQVDEAVEEEREGCVVVGNDLGVNLGGMFDVLGLDGNVEEGIEMGRRDICW